MKILSLISIVYLLFIGCDKNRTKIDPVSLIPGISASAIYKVEAGNVDIPVGREISNDSVFETAAFTMLHEAHIEITVPENIQNFSIHPLSKNIRVENDGRKLSFKLEEPSNLLVKVNNLTPLLLFATPTETNIPDPSDTSVVYFGPGEYHAGRLKLKSNQTVYIEEGAVVYGTLEGYEVENVTISYINLFSYYRNNGGLMLDGCKNYSATNSIILTNDDCICPHALNAAGNGEKNMLFEKLLSEIV